MTVHRISQAREERGKGVPLTDAERAARHYEQYGVFELPERGTGLGFLGQEGESFFRIDNPWLWVVGIGVGIITYEVIK